MAYATKEKKRAKRKEYYKRDKEKLNKQRAEQMRRWRKEHPEQYQQVRRRQIERGLGLKNEVLTHYGNGKCGCVKCGESRLACLSIDHIDAVGEVGRAKHGLNLYVWLKANGYPAGFQTLCMNCQWVKRYENSEMRRWGHKDYSPMYKSKERLACQV